MYVENLNTLIRKGVCSPVFIAAARTDATAWKQATCPSAGDWIKKMRFKQTMEYSSAIWEDEIPSFATTRMDLENIVLSKISQTEKLSTTWFHSSVGHNAETHGHRQQCGGDQREGGWEVSKGQRGPDTG